MTEERLLTCIGCPMGCQITVKLDGTEIRDITGYTCKRGKEYAAKEVTAPARIVTTTVRISGAAAPVVSVKTQQDIPKAKIFDCIRELKDLTVEAPVHIGDVLLQDVAGSGVCVIATKDCSKI